MWQPFSLKQCCLCLCRKELLLVLFQVPSKSYSCLTGEFLAVIMVTTFSVLSQIIDGNCISETICLAPLSPIYLSHFAILSLCRIHDSTKMFSFSPCKSPNPNIFSTFPSPSSFFSLASKRLHFTYRNPPCTAHPFPWFPIKRRDYNMNNEQNSSTILWSNLIPISAENKIFLNMMMLLAVKFKHKSNLTGQSYNTMIKEVLVVVLTLFFGVGALHLKMSHQDVVGLSAGSVNLIADNGGYLRVCQGCGGEKSDSASVEATNDTNSLWTLEIEGNQVAFKGSNGLYLAVCNGCWATQVGDSAFVHIPDKQAISLWTPELQANGRYAFLGSNGNYLGRCNGCTTNSNIPDFAFVKDSTPANDWTQWNVQYTDNPLSGVVTFQADNGGFLKLCSVCIANNSVSVEDGSGPDFQWKVAKVGDKVAFQASNGQWLSRCTNCWTMTKGSYGFSAFANQPNYDDAISQWTPVKLTNGKWAFKSDAGMYLARCHICALTAVDELAFLHVPGYEEYPEAQWTITRVQ